MEMCDLSGKKRARTPAISSPNSSIAVNTSSSSSSSPQSVPTCASNDAYSDQMEEIATSTIIHRDQCLNGEAIIQENIGKELKKLRLDTSLSDLCKRAATFNTEHHRYIEINALLREFHFLRQLRKFHLSHAQEQHNHTSEMSIWDHN
uniref:AlNc14C40G3458 protein n=1 Tax=Albugo laibachii Nc14 TaxID=890382 RepID=F0W9K3_9STRA|nr:AlNc14C40G3458 [Albugo laibachii Nc14]|eukprot:CCA17821.1 AlNc14C40G3458 [Albugo laibachii Nc14]